MTWYRLLLLAYPLEIGRKWIVRNDRRDYRSQVESKESVTVPAGTFSSYRLRNTSDRFPPGMSVSYWYASYGVVKQYYEYTTLAVDQNANIVGTFKSTYEEVLLSVMYEVPSRKDVARVVITKEVVLENVNPTLVPREVERKRERREKSA